MRKIVHKKFVLEIEDDEANNVREIFDMYNDMGGKTIAEELNISIHTVDTHLKHIHLKTKTHSLPELIVWALNNYDLKSDEVQNNPLYKFLYYFMFLFKSNDLIYVIYF